MNPVEFFGIYHQYERGISALRNISLSFREKEITAVIGKSGSGKSTLIQLINGLLKPTEGVIKLFGELLDYNELQELRLQIGYVVQGVGLFPHLTVEENIALPGKISGRQTMNSRIRDLMEMVNLSNSFATKYPYELSGGEQQRVGICRALLLNPPLLLMDEAFTALDPVTTYEIQEEILKLQRQEPRTVIFITHDMRDAKKLGDSIAVLHDGILQQFGNKNEVLSNPANEYVNELINASLA